MDKRISTLIFIYVVYLVVSLVMIFSGTGQKVLAGLFWGGGGIGLLLIFYFIWQQSQIKE